MKKLILLVGVFSILSCGADSPLVGKWKLIVSGPKFTNTEICEFNRDGIEICTSTLLQDTAVGRLEAVRVLTQTWNLENGQLTEKTIDWRVPRITLNGQPIDQSDPVHQEIVSIFKTKGSKSGYTIVRKIDVHENYFDLYSKGGKPNRYTRTR